MEQQHDEPITPGSPEWLNRAGQALTAYLMQDIKDLPEASPQEGITLPRFKTNAKPIEEHE